MKLWKWEGRGHLRDATRKPQLERRVHSHEAHTTVKGELAEAAGTLWRGSAVRLHV